jgi:hypothetical protein
VEKGAVPGVLSLLVVALLVAGCGGSGDTALTKAEFAKQGNAACKEHKAEQQELFKTVSNSIKPSEVTKADQERLISEVLIPPYEKSIESLQDLQAPEGDEKEVEAIIKAMESSVDKVEANPLVALRTTLQFAGANSLAAKYGLTDCVL